MSARLLAYRRLEQVMLDLDVSGDPLADHLRDLMDPLWYALTDEEHAWLDARSPAPTSILATTTPSIPTARRVVIPATLAPLDQAA